MPATPLVGIELGTQAAFVYNLCMLLLTHVRAVGGVKSGEPAGWGVLVCEKAKLTMKGSVVEYVHQVSFLHSGT